MHESAPRSRQGAFAAPQGRDTGIVEIRAFRVSIAGERDEKVGIMIRQLVRHITYERFALAFTGLCILTLFVLVAVDPVQASLEAEPQAVPQRTDTDRPARKPADAPKAASDVSLVRTPAPASLVLPVVVPTNAAKKSAAIAKPITVRPAGSPEKIAEVFDRIGYRLTDVRERGQVPRVFLAALPSDLQKIRQVSQRKMVFIQTALPLILHVNELILNNRAHILSLRKRQSGGAKLSKTERAWLDAKATEFGLSKFSFKALLSRVDMIPPSLALAQSVEESGWGTSRFAREGNALFGQRIWGSGPGIVPTGRAANEKFQVRAFDHLIDGVKSYAMNLNSHRAYRKFREARSRMRREGHSPNGNHLAGALLSYSERGPAYVRTLRGLIRSNEFEMFDDAWLGDWITTDPDAGSKRINPTRKNF